MRFRRRFAFRSFTFLALVLSIAGCSSLPRTSYTVSDAASSTVLDLSELRRYADEPASSFLKADVRFRAGALSYLALSGGGADGAYGAGVLNGWSAAATFEGEFSSVTRSYAGKGVVRYAPGMVIGPYLP